MNANIEKIKSREGNEVFYNVTFLTRSGEIVTLEISSEGSEEEQEKRAKKVANILNLSVVKEYCEILS